MDTSWIPPYLAAPRRRLAPLSLFVCAFLLVGCAEEETAAPLAESEERVMESQEDEGWTPLFNGVSMEGWTHVGDGEFVVEDGQLKTVGGMGLLWYNERPFRDVMLRVVYRNPDSSNAGVFIRIPERPTEPWMPVHRGYEVQIDDSEDDTHVTGVLYSMTEAMARPGQPDQWNVMEITLDGPRTIVHVNGELVTDYTEGDPKVEKKNDWDPERGPRPEEGYIGLQNHGSEDLVLFREISVRDLNE
ncbi:MAG: DUF1080 domain-containing protein [Bacteroidota bacterium]